MGSWVPGSLESRARSNPCLTAVRSSMRGRGGLNARQSLSGSRYCQGRLTPVEAQEFRLAEGIGVHHVTNQRGRGALRDVQFLDLQRIEREAVVMHAVSHRRTRSAPAGGTEVGPGLYAS